MHKATTMKRPAAGAAGGSEEKRPKPRGNGHFHRCVGGQKRGIPDLAVVGAMGAVVVTVTPNAIAVGPLAAVWTSRCRSPRRRS